MSKSFYNAAFLIDAGECINELSSTNAPLFDKNTLNCKSCHLSKVKILKQELTSL